MKPPVPNTGFEILAELGRGTTGIVFKVRDTRLNRIAALKVCTAAPNSSRSNQITRFMRESRALALLTHKPDDTIPAIHMVGEKDGSVFYLREFVDGDTMEQQTASGLIEVFEGVRILETIARAVHRIHVHGFVHRNLQPAKVLIARDSTPKLVGFGMIGILPGSVSASGVTPGVFLNEDLAALQRILAWLYSHADKPIPNRLAAIQQSGAVTNAFEFAQALSEFLNDQSSL